MVEPVRPGRDLQVASALGNVVRDNGPATLSDPLALANLLSHLLPDLPRDASLLVTAAEVDVAGFLRTQVASGMAVQQAMGLAESRLLSARHLNEQSGRWVTYHLATALGYVAGPTDPSQHPTVPSSAPTPGWGAPATATLAPAPSDPTTSRPKTRRRVVGSGLGVVGAVAVYVILALVLSLPPFSSSGSHRKVVATTPATAPAGQAPLPADVVMVVSGQSVTVGELTTNIKVLTKFYGITAPAPSDASAYATFERTAAKAYAIDLILDDVAPAYGVSVSDAQITNEYTTLTQKAAGGSQSQLDQLLSSAGLTAADLRDQIKLQLLEVALYNKVTGQPTVTAAAVQQTYATNQQALTVPETRAISHIVVADQSTAQSIVSQLQQGANFSTLASQDSLDANSKDDGGSLGTVAASQLTGAFAQAAFAAAVNVPFGPVDEGPSGGFDIGLVTQINPTRPPTDDAATQAIIRHYLVGQAQNQRWQAWIGQQLTRTAVRYAPTYRPAQPTAAPHTTAPTLAELVLDQAEGTTAPSPSG